MIKVVIIDDEKNARTTLSKFLAKTNFQIKILGEADDVDSGVELIQKESPDLAFLDIQLKTGTGFDVLQKLSNNQCEIIFVTAYDDYAIKAFQMSAFGYILKPIQLSELNKALQRFEQLTQKNKNDSRTQVLVENMDANSLKKLVVSNLNGFKVVPLSVIIYMQAEVNYTYIFLENGEKLLTSKTMKEYETLLTDYGFFRIHQSYLINLSHVQEYIKGEGGTVNIPGKKSLPVSRRRKKEFIQRFLGGS